MKTECIPFDRLPHTSKLFTDFLVGKANRFYPRSIHFCDWVGDEAKGINLDHARREAVAEVLRSQNKGWSASAKALENIERLKNGASAVVTGQQVGLFGGPLFSIFKALTAIKLAEEATLKGIDCVPIFWLATEDHDFAEVNHANLLGREKTALRRVEVSAGGLEGAPVSARPFAEDVKSAVAAASESLGDSEITDLLRGFYRAGETLGSAMAKFFARLFGEYGLVLLDPSNCDVHRIAAPIFVEAIRRSEELDKSLLQRGKELESAGYHQQVKVTASSTLLFSLESGARVPIKRVNGKFAIGKQHVSADELEQRLSQAPEKFSPNVLLRPIMQDFLLPTLVYVGGPAEVAYFAQCQVVYGTLLGRVTPVLPRGSATLVEEHQQKILQKLSFTLLDVFQEPETVRKLIAAKVMPADLNARFDEAAAQLENTLRSITEPLEKFDPTLADAAQRSASKMRYQLKRLRERTAAAELRRDEVVSRKGAELSTVLFPNKNLQEREIAGISFLARHGIDLVQRLYDTLQTSCPGHQIVNL
jgi:bacillithiol biosynthesis cysteine-adding enzyme BshC